MDYHLSGKKLNFRRRGPNTSAARVFMLLTFIIGGLFLFRSVNTGVVAKPFMPTATPTRTSINHALEGETHFQAGNLVKAIDAYQLALKQDPNNAELWAKLARIQAYSSNMLTTDQQRFDRLNEALNSATRATEVDPESSQAFAVRAFVLDWLAWTPLAETERPSLLTEAEQAASRALTLDNKNALAMAYYAEILVDQQRWTQAEGYIRQALELDQTDMDVFRVNAYVQESLSNYNESIKNYEKAVELMPNMTFLYNSIAKTYRHLRQFQRALDYYEKAVRINETLGIKDPIPYLGIAKTYTQMGEAFSASRNVQKALSYDPSSADVYGQLAIVYFQGRNYEGSVPAFECAVHGCDAETSCEARRCDPDIDPPQVIEGLPLTSNTVVYYYTYGSVLAALHRQGSDYCERAVDVLGEVRDKFSGDTTIMAIIGPSEDICASFGIYR